MSIGSTIKQLRKSRNMTQEQLAEYVGVSACAVSQWECDRTAPDISQLPILANVFSVSADVLLGIDHNKNRAEIAAFIQEYDRLHSQGKPEERLALCRKMQKKYPNEEAVLYRLMRVLQTGDGKTIPEEFFTIGERLLSGNDMQYRFGAIKSLCTVYTQIGQPEKAREYACMVPQNQDLFLPLLNGKELVTHCQSYFWKTCFSMYQYMMRLVECEECGYTPTQKHDAMKSLYDIIHIVFSAGDFGFMEYLLARICLYMAIYSIDTGETERALDELEEMLFHVKKETMVGEQVAHSSLLVNQLVLEKANVIKRNLAVRPAVEFWRYLHVIKAAQFAPICEEPRFIAVKDALTEL